MTVLSAHALRVVSILADTGNSGDGGEGNKAGPIGLAVILLLIIACAFLFKSMSKHLRKVRDGFPGGNALTVNSATATATAIIGGPPQSVPAAEPPRPAAESRPGRDPDE